MGHLSFLRRAEIESLGPPTPEELEETGVAPAFLRDLALKHVATFSDPTTATVAEKLHLPLALVAAFALPVETMKSVARDLAAILVGFALIWMYFTWSQFLVIWYGNLPADTSYVIKRLSGGWRTIAWTVFACRCAVPVVVLLTPFGRRQPMLAITATIVVIGFWIECW